LLDAADPTLTFYVNGLLPELPKPGFEDRVRAFGPAAPDAALYDAFALSYATHCPDSAPPNYPFFPPVHYVHDATYLLALAAVAGEASPDPLSGAALGDGLSKLAPPGLSVGLRPGELSEIVATLAAEADLDLHGASGHLDFDLRTGHVVASGTRVLCISQGTSTADWAFAGQTYDAAADMLVGSYACPPSP
jgi:hypothetical protein